MFNSISAAPVASEAGIWNPRTGINDLRYHAISQAWIYCWNLCKVKIKENKKERTCRFNMVRQIAYVHGNKEEDFYYKSTMYIYSSRPPLTSIF